jgi:hypothetical protein
MSTMVEQARGLPLLSYSEATVLPFLLEYLRAIHTHVSPVLAPAALNIS